MLEYRNNSGSIQARLPGPTVDSAGSTAWFPLTSYGNAERLVCLHGHDMRFCPKTAKWFVWTGKYWRNDQGVEIERLAKQTVRSIYKEAANMADDNQRRLMVDHAKSSETSRQIRDMINLARSEHAIELSQEGFNADKWLLNLDDGTLDLRSGELRSHSRDDLLNYVLPLRFNTEAQCPQWLDFLSRIMPDEEIRSYLQRAVGYSLTGDTGEQCFFFLHGKGANGKSTFLKILESLLSELGHRAKAETFMASTRPRNRSSASPELSAMQHKRLITVSEIARGQSLDAALMKDLTGGDSVSTRALYSSETNFTPQFKIWMCGNYRPEIRDLDEGIWRRVHLIEFKVQIPDTECDPMLGEKLQSELPGILNWALEGTGAWRKERQLLPPASVLAANNEYHSEMDTVGQFIDEECECYPGAQARAGELYERYKEFCKSNQLHHLTNKEFSSELDRRGFEKPRVGKGYKRLGIELCLP